MEWPALTLPCSSTLGSFAPRQISDTVQCLQLTMASNSFTVVYFTAFTIHSI